jgi:hypothetical protein
MIEIITTSAVTTALISLVLWLLRTWIKERLSADIRLENDSKLLDIKAKIDRTNEKLSSISSNAGLAFYQSKSALIPYKIKAIETIWHSILAWNEMSVASLFVSVLPLDWVRENGADPATTKHFESLLKSPGHHKFLKDRNTTEEVRPFVSDRIWALYSAYHSFYISRISKASFFLIPDMDHAKVWERMNERKLIEASAPIDVLNKYDANILDGTNDYLNFLKNELVKAFQIELSGENESRSAITNTANILKAAEELINQTVEKPSTVTI